MRWLSCQLRTPFGAFGGEAIDAYGVTRLFTAKSMLTGMVANALGWHRSMRSQHQELQSRFIFGICQETNAGERLFVDYQTVKLDKNDKMWTTHGKPAKRGGGTNTYIGSHQRWRTYISDLAALGVFRLDPDELSPTLDDVANALEFPFRTLFIGRKSCLPSSRILLGWVEAPNTHAALQETVNTYGHQSIYRAMWPFSVEEPTGVHVENITDERNWRTGLHGGSRAVCHGEISKRSTA